MIRKLLKSKRAEGHLDVVIGVVALAMFIVVALNIFTFVSLKTTMDRIADDLIEVATYSGAFSDDFELKVDQLKAKYFDFDVEVYAEEYFNAEHKRVQMGEKMGITIRVNSSVAGIDIALPIDLTVSRVGQSEQYWRIASGVYEEPEIDYTGKTLFVVNISTNTFHYPHCSSLQKILEENRKEVYSTAAELMEYGYSPCGTCDVHDCSTNTVTHFNVYGHWGFCETCGKQDQVEEHWWAYDEMTDTYYCEYCEAIEDKTGHYCCSGGSMLTEEAHPMGCGCHLTPPTLVVNDLSTDSANPTILEQTGTIRITGYAKDREGAILRVTVNGENAQLYADGEWYYDLIFNNTTSSTITIIAIDEDGMETMVNCYAELPVTLVTITQANKYEIMDAIGVDYTLTGYPLTIPEYYFVDDTKYKIIGIGDRAFRNENVGTVLIKGANREYFTIGEEAFSGTTICELKIESASIKSFGDYAFENCTELITAQIPGSKNPGYGTFSGCAALTNVYLSDSITELGDEMFYNCVALRQIDLKNVTSIGTMCFYSCKLDAIDLSNVKHIYWSAFQCCTELIEVKIPKLTTWESGVFYGCSSLERVTIASGNTYIPESTFDGCTSLESVSCPNSTIQEIGPYAFYDCGNYMPSTWVFQSPLTTIGDYAFCGCSSITEFVFNKEIEYIGERAFYVYDEVETDISGDINSVVMEYDWSGDNRKIPGFAGILYSDGTYMPWDKAVEVGAILLNGTTVTDIDESAIGIVDSETWEWDGRNYSIVFPAEITHIDGWYLDYVNEISFVEGSNLTTFGSSSSYSLKKADFSNTKLAYVGSFAFMFNNSLEEVLLPDTVEFIGDGAFEDTHLSSITIPVNCTSIDDRAFYCYYDTLQSIIFEGEVTFIGTDAFYADLTTETRIYGNLTDAVHDYDWEGSSRYTGATVTISSTNKVDAGYKDNSSTLNIRDVYVDSATNQIVKPIAIGVSAFSSDTSLNAVHMPTTITAIYSNAFEECTQLQTVTGLQNIETIGSRAFYNCNQLNGTLSLISATDIYANAFYGCRNLDTANMPLIQTIGGSAFRNCTSLYSVTTGTSLTTISNYAFNGCTALRNMTLPTSLTTIGAYAFQDCSALETVTIPSSVTSVGVYAFQDCTSLYQLRWLAACSIPNYCFQNAAITSITISGATTIETGAFSNAIKGSSAPLGIPYTVTRIGDYAFTSCTGISQVTLGSGVQRVGAYAFQHCSSMKAFNINSGSSLMALGEGVWAYSGLTQMTTLKNATKLAELPVKAFYGCSGITQITIPSNIKKIGANAFGNCKALTNATLEEDENLSLVTSPWYVSTSSNATSGTSITRIQAINTSTAANLLRNTYVNYYWFRRSA